MNREEKRKLKKQGLSEKGISDLEYLTTPCTLAEAVQVARGVVEDALTDYNEKYTARLRSTVIIQSIHIEVMKNIILDKGILTEEEYKELLSVESRKYEERQRELQEKAKKLAEEAEEILDEEGDDNLVSFPTEDDEDEAE